VAHPRTPTVAATLDAEVVRRWAAAAEAGLAGARGEIDAINVFPIADRDTGTNLAATWSAAARAAESAAGAADAVAVLQAMADAALDAAQGSSGTILSQFLRGCAAGGPDLVRALTFAADAAYAAVAEPVEGTILTVARAAAHAAEQGTGDAAAVAQRAADAARAELPLTAGLLPALAAAGVVDAGGRGLVVVLDALAVVVAGGDPEPDRPPSDIAVTCSTEPGQVFEVQFRLEVGADVIPGLQAELTALGDAVVVAGGPGGYQVHVHATDAGAVIDAALEVGRPRRIRVSALPAVVAPVTVAVLAIAPGGALANVFRTAGANVLVPNPGEDVAADLRRAVRDLGAQTILLLPNDRDIRAAAEAVAAESGAGPRVIVIPTRSPMQGIAALAVHDPAAGPDAAAVVMSAAAAATRYAAIVVAEEDALTTVGPCRAGDVLGLIDDDVAVIDSDLAGAARGILDRLLIGGGELVTIVAADGQPREIAAMLVDYLAATRPVVETTVYDDGDPSLPILVGVE
jgi:DAK2 domain fusion protein YloV